MDANLNGAGDSLHMIAAGLNGTLGLAMVNGEIDNYSLNHLLGPILTSASLPLSLINPGQSIRGGSALRCFAARLDARDGLATFRTLYLDSARVKVSGSGTINLADEAPMRSIEVMLKYAQRGDTRCIPVGASHGTAAISARTETAMLSHAGSLICLLGVELFDGSCSNRVRNRHNPLGMPRAGQFPARQGDFANRGFDKARDVFSISEWTDSIFCKISKAAVERCLRLVRRRAPGQGHSGLLAVLFRFCDYMAS
jgi:hypothetical protein